MRLKRASLIYNIIFLLILIPGLAITSSAQQEEKQPSINLTPLLKEQFVYSLNVFDGKGWSGSFVPKTESTIYLIANKDNAICAKKTLVYFWPITVRYIAAWRTLDEDVEGVLEVLKDGKIIEKLKKQDTVLCYPEGYWGEKVVLYKGNEAIKWYKKYKKAEDEYYKALNKYYEARIEYRKKMNKFFEEIKKRREKGEKGPLNIEIPKEPEPPKPPNFFVTEPKKYYVLNLPVGKYKIRLRAKDKTIVEGSEKELLVFTARRREGVGYEIIPGNRWTKREECNDPANAIYAAGKNVLYFRPYRQDEYNELYHNKLLDPQNGGRIENWKWVHTEPIKNVQLLLFSKDNLLKRIDKKPYKVEQIPGPELGYNIVEFKKGKLPGEKPTFEGYQLILSENLPGKSYRIYLQKEGKNNNIISTSEREIRLVKRRNANFLFYLSIFPLIIGGVVFVLRHRKIEK